MASARVKDVDANSFCITCSIFEHSRGCAMFLFAACSHSGLQACRGAHRNFERRRQQPYFSAPVSPRRQRQSEQQTNPHWWMQAPVGSRAGHPRPRGTVSGQEQ